MREATHSALPLSIPLVGFAIALCAATAALALPPRAEGAIHLGSPNTVSLANGLVGYWPLDGATTNWATGVTRDLSGNGNNGSLALMSTSSSAVVGKIGQALTFNGSTNYIDAGSSATLNPESTITVSAWIYPTAYSYAIPIGRDKDNQSESVYALKWRSSPEQPYWPIQDSGGTSHYVYLPTIPSLNTWTHTVMTYDGNIMRAYVNDVQVDSTQFSATLLSSAKSVQIGRGILSEYFQGKVDDVRIYNRALSATEIKQLYNLGAATIGHSNAMISNGLVRYWTFDGGATNWTTGVTRDLSGNGNNGSLAFMSTSSSPAIGKIGQALKFDGSTNYISAPSAFNSTSGSWSAWIKIRTFAHDGVYGRTVLYQSDGAPNNEIRLYVDPSPNSPNWYGYDGVDYVWETYSPGSLSTNTWYHVVGPYDGTVAKLYIDGQIVDSAPQTGPVGSLAAPFVIGEIKTNSDEVAHYSGEIDDVRIYNRALSSIEIKQLYKSGAVTIGHSNAIISDGLVGYWTFDGGSIDWRTNTVRDMSGNGNTGSLVSMSTSSSPAIGKIGQALNFVRASSQFIRTDNNLQFQPPFSFTVWVNAADIPSGTLDVCENYYPAIASDEIGGYGWNLLLGGISGPTGFYIARWANGGNNEEGVVANSTFTLNKWYHIVGVYTPTKTSIYVNGVLDNTAPAAFPTLFYYDVTSAFGKEGCGNEFQYFNGKIDDVRIYNRALSATEIKQLYNAGR